MGKFFIIPGMKKLVFEMRRLCRANRDGSYETQRKRELVLMRVAHQLSGELGYIHMGVSSLKPRHVDALLKKWQSESLSIATIKARMSYLRWWSRNVNKQNVVAPTNSHYGIKDRTYSRDFSKAIDISDERIEKIEDHYVRASIMLAKEFGLRKEESIKIIPRAADDNNMLYLKASWCKGGRQREIPIRTERQRSALYFAKDIARSSALIPFNRNYYKQRIRLETVMRKHEMTRLHGLRHRYAQMRYKELAGWESPHRGGPKRSQMNTWQREVDKEARLTISRELGHNRIEIVVNYIG